MMYLLFLLRKKLTLPLGDIIKKANSMNKINKTYKISEGGWNGKRKRMMLNYSDILKRFACRFLLSLTAIHFN